MNSAKGIYLYTICKRFLTCMIIKKILLCGARLADDAGIVTADSDSPGNVFLCMNLQMSSSELAESRTFCRWWFAFLLQNRWRLRALINRYRTSSYTLSDGDIVTMNYYNAWVYNYIYIYITYCFDWQEELNILVPVLCGMFGAMILVLAAYFLRNCPNNIRHLARMVFCIYRNSQWTSK